MAELADYFSATAAENGSVLNTEDVMWADVCVQVRAGTRQGEAWNWAVKK